MKDVISIRGRDTGAVITACSSGIRDTTRVGIIGVHRIGTTGVMDLSRVRIASGAIAGQEITTTGLAGTQVRTTAGAAGRAR